MRTQGLREDGARAAMRARVERIVTRPGVRSVIGRDARRDAHEWLLHHPQEAAERRRCHDSGTNELFTEIEAAEEEPGEILLVGVEFRARLAGCAIAAVMETA